MTQVLLGQVGDDSAAAIRVAAWIAVASLLAGAWLFSTRAPWSFARSAAWLLVAMAVVLAVYGTPTAWRSWTSIWSTARQDFVDPTWSRLGPLAGQPLTWGLLLGAVALWLALPASNRRRRLQAVACGIVSLGFLAGAMPWLGGWGPQLVYWTLAATTMVSAAFSICMRNAVYVAVWFALSVLGASGLFFYNGAQFLGAATVVVYAGSIIVTFLFVIMLAQPEGNAVYDRISWASFAQPLSLLAAAAMVGAMALAISTSSATARLRSDAAFYLQRHVDQAPEISENSVARFAVEQHGQEPRIAIALRGADSAAAESLQQSLNRELGARVAVEVSLLDSQEDVLNRHHVAQLGSRLFGRHMLSIELAGALLLAALVGAIAIVIHGRPWPPVRGAP